MAGLPPLALTCGEPAGIGAEIALKAWTERDSDGPAFLLIDQPARIARVAEHIGLQVPIATIASPGELRRTFSQPPAYSVVSQGQQGQHTKPGERALSLEMAHSYSCTDCQCTGKPRVT